MSTVGIVIEKLKNFIEMLAKVYRNVKTTSHYHNPHPLLYKPAEHIPSSFGQIFRVPKV